jgi:hypothetical protein
MSVTRSFCVICLWLFASMSSAQDQPADPLALLDHLAGNWVLQGKIDGKQTVHDVEAHWILRHEYLQLHEISREKTAEHGPAYEAIILISWDPKAEQYSCLWLDSTAGGALSSGVTCRAKRAAQSIPFIFTISPSESIHTTFTHLRSSDSWRWTIDNESNGKWDRFADVQLLRSK